ncbi:MAG: hypothetical protein JF631_05935, partial [Mycobacterium sp.]|nr:hypothetical protein [Mycobacterium sp.]
ARRFGGTVVDRFVAPILALVVVGVAEVTEFYGQTGIYKWAPYVMLGWMAIGIVARLITRGRVAPLEREAEATQGELTPTPAV